MPSSKELTSRCLRLSSSYLIRRSKDQQASARPLVRLTVDQKVLPSAFALDLFGFGMYPCPSGAAGAMSFHDPLEGTETSLSYMDQFFIALHIRLCRSLRLKLFLCRSKGHIFQEEGGRKSNQGKDQNSDKAVLE